MTQELLEQWRQEDEAERSRQGGGEGVRAMLEASSDLNTAGVARSLELARALDLPENIVLEIPDWAEQEYWTRKILQNPLLSQWIEKDRKNAAVVREDTDALLEMFEAARATGDPGDLEEVIDAMRMDREEHRRWEQTRESVHGVIKPYQPGILEQIPLLLREGGEEMQLNMAWFLSGLARFLGRTRGKDSEGKDKTSIQGVLFDYADKADERLTRFEESRSARLTSQTALGRYFQDLVRQAPQFGGQILASVSTGPVGGLLFTGSQITGGQYRELRKKRVDPDRAFLAGIMDAAVQAPMERVGLEKWLRIFKTSGMRNILKRTAEGMATEGATEYFQEYSSSAASIWGQLKEDEGAREWLERFVTAIPETHSEGLYSAAVAAPFGIYGGLVKASSDAQRSRKAAEFRDAHNRLHEKVAATKIKHLSAEFTEKALVFALGKSTGSIAAQDVIKLQQSGLPLLKLMRWKETEVLAAAVLGQDVSFSLARAHAVLDQTQFAAVMENVRADPEAMNATESAMAKKLLESDADSLAERLTKYAEEQKDLEGELGRLRREITEALRSVPRLEEDLARDTKKEEKTSGEAMTLEKAADHYMQIVERLAGLLARHGVSPAKRLRKISYQGLVLGENGKLLTPEEALNRETQRIRQDEEQAFWQEVWGKIDEESLEGAGYSAQELRALHGPGLFAPKGSGVSLETLARELRDTGLLESNADADTLYKRTRGYTNQRYR